MNQSAVEFLIGTDFVIKVGYVNIKLCQQNAQIVSNLVKSIYSCKNVV